MAIIMNDLNEIFSAMVSALNASNKYILDFETPGHPLCNYYKDMNNILNQYTIQGNHLQLAMSLIEFMKRDTSGLYGSVPLYPLVGAAGLLIASIEWKLVEFEQVRANVNYVIIWAIEQCIGCDSYVHKIFPYLNNEFHDIITNLFTYQNINRIISSRE